MKVTIIGAANIDIITKSKTVIIPGDSNPADIKLKAGGVARNIAEILALRKVDVDFITAIGDDPFGTFLRKSCADIGISTDAWIVKNNISTGIYLASLDNTGELYVGFNATSAPESISVTELTKLGNRIKNADLLILDLNLSEKIIVSAIELRNERPIMVDAVSSAKVPRIKDVLGKIDILKLNRLEAEALTGITLDTKQRVKKAAYTLVDCGAKRVFITLGIAGVCAADADTAFFVPAVPMVVKDVTGAGDAFTAGIAMTFADDLQTQAEAGIKLAAEHLEKRT
jgi:pseudouridine kinase